MRSGVLSMLENLNRTTMSFSPISEEEITKLYLATIDILENAHEH